MARTKPRPFFWDSLVRGARFFYLLWGGMLLCTLSMYDKIKVPAEFWNWPGVAQFVIGPWGRGLVLGLGITMAFSALLEVWELVDILLSRLLHDSGQDR